MKTCIITLFLISLAPCATYQLWAQSIQEIALMKSIVSPPNQPRHIHLASENNRNEFQYLFSGLFLFYKTFISSQDGQSCSFTPSCSEFGLIAVKKQGVLIGILNTFDRLQRCNGLSPEKYPIDKNSRLLYDPVE